MLDLLRHERGFGGEEESGKRLLEIIMQLGVGVQNLTERGGEIIDEWQSSFEGDENGCQGNDGMGTQEWFVVLDGLAQEEGEVLEVGRAQLLEHQGTKRDGFFFFPRDGTIEYLLKKLWRKGVVHGEREERFEVFLR